MNHQRLSHLIEQYQNGTATDEELQELDNWYNTLDYGDKGLDDWIRDERGTDSITNRMFVSFSKELQQAKQPRIKVVALRIAAVAASILICAGLFFLFRNANKSHFVAQEKNYPIKPGTTTAILTLGNGSQLILNAQPNGQISSQNGVLIKKQKNGLLTYIVSPSTVAQIAYNSIETPRGGEYEVVLPDGTKVWLNAASKLTYPTRFNGKERIVKLSGEAYFEVAHNPQKPFHVLFSGQDVKVLGTHFNINAYPDEAESKTTLLQGSITLTNIANHSSVLLKPGQQAASAQNSSNITLYPVNLEQVISWKNGYFQFDNMNIAVVMRALSRWYDIDVKYEHADLTETYGGTFSRNSDLKDILKNITSLGNVRFITTDRTIIVESKKGG